MINKDMARDYMNRSARCLKEAEIALSDNDAPMVIRRSQESLELGTKALLRAMAIEYPREHDVTDALIANRKKLPESLGSRIDELVRLVTELASVRGPAFYGYESEGVPASRAFSIDYATGVLNSVRELVAIISNELAKVL